MGTGAIGRLFLNRRSAALLVLGFSSGLPNVVLVSVFAFWLTEAGASESQIGMLSLASIPYAVKFLWAPLVDNRRPWLPLPWGRRRTWIGWMQILLVAAMALTAIAASSTDPFGSLPGAGAPAPPDGSPDMPGAATHGSDGATALAWILLTAGVVIGLLSATQDISVDAYRADVADDETRASAASMSVTGYRLALAGAGAGAIMLATRIGWVPAMALTALAMLLCAGGTMAAPDPPDDRAPRRDFAEAVVAPLESLRRRLGGRAWLVALFVIAFKLPDTLPQSMVPPLLMRQLGYQADDVAIMRQAVGLGTTIVGALLGAALVPRLGMRRSLLVFGVLQAASTGAFAALALWRIPADHGTGFAHWIAPGTLALIATVIVEYGCAGLVTAGFVAYLMSLCDRRWSATHYAILTSLVALGAALAGMAGGRLVEALASGIGAERAWPAFFALSALAGVPALLLVPAVTGRALAPSTDSDPGR